MPQDENENSLAGFLEKQKTKEYVEDGVNSLLGIYR